MSSSYERMNYITSFGFSIRWRNQFLATLQSTEKKIEILDLLTGMGETWKAIKRKFPNAHLSALDFSEKMLTKAEKKNIHHFNNEITFLKQDVLQNNIPDNHFDIVICAFGLKTFNHEQLITLANETLRILKPGGQFAFVEVSAPENLILKSFYGFYLRRMIPILGWLFLGNPTEYKMLWRYTDTFKNAKVATQIFNRMGLQTKFNSYFFDCATGFSGHKV